MKQHKRQNEVFHYPLMTPLEFVVTLGIIFVAILLIYGVIKDGPVEKASHVVFITSPFENNKIYTARDVDYMDNGQISFTDIETGEHVILSEYIIKVD